ncbi:integrase, partial [Desulfobacterales bacterium HSG17]|nr:integrase [Desulfobacterales bacterium HSG17]
MGKKIEIPDNSTLALDDRFLSLLHKKIMHKRGAAKRQAKKYYIDQYKKTGVIPSPLILAGKGIMEGRRCSGRKRSLSQKVEKHFIEMVKASADLDDNRFIFVTQKARTITNYHKWLEEDFGWKISQHALRSCAKRENLNIYLKKPDFDEDQQADTYFNPEPVFDLVQVDGCNFHYLKIRDENGHWRKPQVIEFYDTGSRYMFVLDVYFSESSLNSVDLFTQFLLSTPFPNKKIRIRPDNAKGFLNLKRPIRELNLKYSIPEKFYMEPDFSRVNAPKDKVHLESSHRHLHN